MSVVKHQPWGSRGCWWGWRKGAPSYNSTVHVQQHAQQGYLQVSYNTTQVVVVVVGFTIHTHISYSYQLLPYWPLVYQPCHRHISLILFTQVRACQSASTVVCACVCRVQWCVISMSWCMLQLLYNTWMYNILYINHIIFKICLKAYVFRYYFIFYNMLFRWTISYELCD